MIINTIYIIVITLLIATPIGVGAAIYLNEYARSTSRVVRAIEFTLSLIHISLRADEIFSVLMGDQVQPRKDFITENAGKVKNLDI